MSDGSLLDAPKLIDTYALYESFAKGGMASAHYALHLRPGFSRPVAIKRLHPHLASEEAFVCSFLEEARLAGRVRHPNVVPTLDVVSADGEILLVLEYVAGESLSQLLRKAAEQGRPVPLSIVCSIATGLLDGLHAAHEAVDEQGRPLHLVHRDVSPQNVMVGLDGVTRVLDFGIAKAAGSLDTTREGQLRGKIAYMAPEQLSSSKGASRASDIYSAGVLLWEMLTLRRMFQDDNPMAIGVKILAGTIEPPSRHVPELPPEIETVVMSALAKEPHERFATAREMGVALVALASAIGVAPASNAAVGAWVEELAGSTLRDRSERVAQLERAQAAGMTTPHVPTLPSVTMLLRPPEPPVQPPVQPPFQPPVVIVERRSSLVALAGLCVVLGIVVIVLAMQRPKTVAAPIPQETAAPTPPPTLEVAPSAEGVASAAVPTGGASATSIRHRRGSTPTAAPVATKSKIDCSPPWIVDKDGIHQYKKGCFQ